MDKPKTRILVAEDEESLREMLALVYEDEGYDVDIATDGREAWQLINANHYDLLATDLYMPTMNGVELILKCQEKYPELKIILFSGGGKEIKAEHGKRSIEFKGQNLEVNMFMRKPCDLDELIEFVKQVLNE